MNAIRINRPANTMVLIVGMFSNSKFMLMWKIEVKIWLIAIPIMAIIPKAPINAILPFSPPNLSWNGRVMARIAIIIAKINMALIINSSIGKVFRLRITNKPKSVIKIQLNDPNNRPKQYFSLTYPFRVIGKVNKKAYPLL